MYISNFCHNRLKMTPNTSAKVQLGLSIVILISVFIFSDFFVGLSIYIAILYPLYLFYVWLSQNIMQSLQILN